MTTQRIERCLSVQQPSAWAVCVGDKTIENRSWSTDYRGTIAIHASSTKTIVNAVVKGRRNPGFDAEFFAYGAIIGVADLVDCVEMNPDLEDDPWTGGPVCWKLENARLIPRPIAMKGKLNLFKLDATIARRVEARLLQPEPKLDAKKRQKILELIRPGPLELCRCQAASYVDLGRFEDAVRLASQVIERDPAGCDGYHLRAIAYHGLGRFEEALGDVDKAIDVERRLAPLYHIRAVVKERLGDMDGMRDDWEKARKLGADLPPFDELEWEEANGSTEDEGAR